MRTIPTSRFADLSIVVNLSACRRQKRPRSPKSQKPNILQRPESPQIDFWLAVNFRERMKVNAIFAEAFGPEHLAHQHSQIGDVGVTTILHSASGARTLF